mmetsp:Transcript_56390/g.167839  ORF Transcript_56390/g.167839 Transcript_56390/m.167839 type:complete len:313 (-) Transcript_56390:70-1008(-)
MGCSAASKSLRVHRIESSKVKKKGGPVCNDSLGEALNEAVGETRRRDLEEVGSITETGTVLSRSTSVRSVVSGVTSLHSSLISNSNKYHPGTKWKVEDLQSEVPAISESVADMEDLQEISREENVVIDNRQHPLAPSNISLYSAESKLSSTNPTFGADLGSCSDVPSIRDYRGADLGGCSDVPSVRDDASVASAASEVPGLGYRRSRTSISRCGSKAESDNGGLPHRHSAQERIGRLGQGGRGPLEQRRSARGVEHLADGQLPSGPATLQARVGRGARSPDLLMPVQDSRMRRRGPNDLCSGGHAAYASGRS